MNWDSPAMADHHLIAIDWSKPPWDLLSHQIFLPFFFTPFQWHQCFWSFFQWPMHWMYFSKKYLLNGRNILISVFLQICIKSSNAILQLKEKIHLFSFFPQKGHLLWTVFSNKYIIPPWIDLLESKSSVNSYNMSPFAML